jgi:hypothetical protein
MYEQENLQHSGAVERAKQLAQKIQLQREQRFEEEQSIKKSAFEESISNSAFDIADYWANSGKYTSAFDLSSSDTDEIAEKVGGYRPRILRDVGVGILQTFQKSDSERIAQEQLRDAQARGLGVPSDYIKEIKRNVYDREQRTLWGGLGAGLLHNWYKKGLAPVDAANQNLTDFLPATTQAELEFGAGQFGAYTGTGIGLVASTYGTGAALRGLGLVSGAGKVRMAQEMTRDLFIANSAKMGLGKTGASLLGDALGAGVETAVFDVMRGEEDWVQHQGYAAGTILAFYGLGTPAVLAKRIANNSNRKILQEALPNKAIAVSEPPVSQVIDTVKKSNLKFTDDVLTSITDDIDRANFIQGRNRLIELENTMQPLSSDAIDDAILNNSTIGGKPAVNYSGDYQKYLDDFNKAKTQQLNEVTDNTISKLSTKSMKELGIKLQPELPDAVRYNKWRDPRYSSVFDDVNAKEFVRMNKNSLGDYSVKNLSPEDARTILNRLDNLYDEVSRGIIDDSAKIGALKSKLKQDYSGLGLVKTGKEYIDNLNKKFINEKSLDRGEYNHLRVIKTGLDNIERTKLDIKKLNEQLLINRGIINTTKVHAQAVNRQVVAIQRQLADEVNQLTKLRDKTMRALDRYALRTVAEEKTLTKKRLMQSLADSISDDIRQNARTLTGRKLSAYKKVADDYLKNIDEYFTDKALSNVESYKLDLLEKHSNMTRDIYQKYSNNLEEYIQRADVANRKVQAYSNMNADIAKVKAQYKKSLELMNKYDLAVVDSVSNKTYSAKLVGNKYVFDMGGDKFTINTLSKNANPEEILREMTGYMNAKNGFIANGKNINVGIYKYMANAITTCETMGLDFIPKKLYTADLHLSADRKAYMDIMQGFRKELSGKENIAFYQGAAKKGKDAYLKSSQRLFLALDGKLPLAELNVAEQKAYKFMRESFRDLGVKMGMTEDDMIQEYVTHVIDPKYRNQMMKDFYEQYGGLSKEQAMAREYGDIQVWSGGLDDIRMSNETIKEIRNNFLKARQSGAPVVEDAFFAFERYIDESLPKIYYEPAMESINNFMYMNRNNLPQNVKSFINGYLRDTVTKRGSDATIRANQIFADSVKSVANSLQVLPLPLTIKEKLKAIDYSSPRFFDNSVTSILRWAYGSKMAYNPTSPITNYFQKLLIYPFAGMDDIAKYANPKYNAKSAERVIINGIDYGSCAEILNTSNMLKMRLASGTFSTAPEVVGGAMGKPFTSNIIDEATSIGFTGFRWVDIDNVKTAYLAGYSKAVKSGMAQADAIKYAEYVAETTQFIYSRSTRSAVNRSPMKLLTTFSTWSMGYMNWYAETARLFGAEGVIRGSALQFAIPLTLTAMTGYDFSRFTPSQITMDYIYGKTEQLNHLMAMMPGVNTDIVALNKLQKGMEGKDWLMNKVESDAPRNKSKAQTLGKWLFNQ